MSAVKSPYEATVSSEDIQETSTNFSDEFQEMLLGRSIHCCTNWLYTYGVPSTPAELQMFARTLYMGGIGLHIAEGWLALTEKATASEDERQKNEAVRAEAAQVMEGLSEGLTQQSFDVSTGQYL